MGKRMDELACRPCPFQKGDAVKTPTGVGTVTAVGFMGSLAGAAKLAIVYRVGRNNYWHGWQLTRSKSKVRE